MKDGHVNKCKDCSLIDAASHRAENIEKIRAYDRGRGNRQDAGYFKEYREGNPKKYKAHTMVNNQKRAGNISELPCEVCGEVKVVAHHDDYDKPLNVRWLCQAHHKQWHAANGEGDNAN
tara:strand:+ start:200 stop:556 length:357 start_codon:yes stop_codon:yes gene_type:complete